MPQDGSAVEYARWKELVGKLHNGKYSDETITDYIVQERHALIITDKRLIYCNFVKETFKWAVRLKFVSSVSVFGHEVLIHFWHEVHVRGRKVKIPSRKRVVCRTRDLRSSMLVKVDHAIRLKDKEAAKLLKAEEKAADDADTDSPGSVVSFSPDKVRHSIARPSLAIVA